MWNNITNCSLALDQNPTFGIVKGIYECIKGKDFVTEEKLTTSEMWDWRFDKFGK